MLFKKRTADLDTMVDHLAALGMNTKGKSLFLDSDDISSDLVLEFVQRCEADEEAFRLAEDILRFSNVYNALTVLLKLKDKALEGRILARLRDPSIFLTRYEGTSRLPSEERRRRVEKGFGFFMDYLQITEKLIVIGAHEILASRFMGFLSEGKIGKEDDKRIWLTFSLGIYNHLITLPQAIVKSKQRLRLR
jgi:hypothetical protein